MRIKDDEGMVSVDAKPMHTECMENWFEDNGL